MLIGAGVRLRTEYTHKGKERLGSPWWATAFSKATVAVCLMLLAAYPYFHLRAKLKYPLSFISSKSTPSPRATHQANGRAATEVRLVLALLAQSYEQTGVY